MENIRTKLSLRGVYNYVISRYLAIDYGISIMKRVVDLRYTPIPVAFS